MLVTSYPSSIRFRPSDSRNKSSSSTRSKCGIGEVLLGSASGDQLSQTILAPGRIGGIAFERIMQGPHPAASQIEIKKQVELAGGSLVPPYRSRRLFGSLHRCPEQA